MIPISAPWKDLVLVCGKCSKKLGGGFGPKGKQKLAKALRAELKGAGRRRAVRVVEVGCFGLCPKRAVTVVGGRPGTVWAVPSGTNVEDVISAVASSVPPSG